MTVEIEHGIPIPANRFGGDKWGEHREALSTMAIGDSFLIPASKLTERMRAKGVPLKALLTTKNSDPSRKYAVRMVFGGDNGDRRLIGCRVWRVK
jgi:hypothetical protein